MPHWGGLLSNQQISELILTEDPQVAHQRQRGQSNRAPIPRGEPVGLEQLAARLSQHIEMLRLLRRRQAMGITASGVAFGRPEGRRT
jgi:hypothetical protein